MKLYICALLPFFISLFLSWYFIPRIQYVSIKKRLFDVINDRKIHKGAISRLGGIAFFPVFFVLSALFISMHITWTEFFDLSITLETSVKEWILSLCCCMILYLAGIGDDLVGLRYKYKFVIQILAGIIFTLSGLYLNNLYGIFGIYEIPAYLGISFTIFIIVFIINAMNLIDGIDGLASGLSMIAFLFFGCIFIYLKMWFYCIQAFIALGMLVPFFYYNVFGSIKKGRRIFMGDVGSFTIGILLSVFIIKLCYFEQKTITADIPHIIVIAFSLLIVPMFDVIRVVMHRVRTGCHPFKPDKNHIHHKFLNLGLSHRQTMMIVLLIAFVFGISNILFSVYANININILLLSDIFIWSVLHILLTIKIRKRSIETDAGTA